MKRKFLGILGGMGAQAGSYLMQKVLDHTPAHVDQDHLEILLYSNPQVPDRTEDILGIGPSAKPELIRSAKMLERAGVDCLAIACVTAHHHVEALRAAVSPMLLSMVEETAKHLFEKYPDQHRVGLLATTGTIQAEFVQHEFEQYALNLLVPPSGAQEQLVMDAVYGEQGIKAGFLNDENRNKLLEASAILVDSGANVIVAGCTEIPLVLNGPVGDVPIIDMIDILAYRLVDYCCGTT